MKRNQQRVLVCGWIGVLAIGLMYCLPASADGETGNLAVINTELRGHEDRWTFVGRSEWTQDTAGIINCPTWRFATDDLLNYWPHEQDDRQREDFAFLHDASVGDMEMSVKIKLYSQTTYGKILFHSQDSRRCYVLQVRNVYEKDIYELALWVQNEDGFGRRLGQGLAGTTDIRTYAGQKPKWDTIRVTTTGSRIEAWLNSDRVISVNDDTFRAGAIGLGSLGRIQYKDLHLKGKILPWEKPWASVTGDTPPFVYPFESDTADLTKPTNPTGSWPSGIVLDNGEIILFRDVQRSGDFAGGTMMVTSRDHGRTWSDEAFLGTMNLYWPFQHKDGRLSALTSVTLDKDGKIITKMTTEMHKAVDEGRMTVRQEPMIVYSDDHGKTWGPPQPFNADGKPLSTYGRFWIYQGFQRLSDGTVIWCPYGGKTENTVAEKRTNQTFVVRSEDDGRTWSAPIAVEESHYDTNEGAVAELDSGDLLMFMRSVRSPYMWKARSQDKGRTWLPLERTNITLDCPQFRRHSSGLLVLQTRGGAVQISEDDGESWGPVWNIGHAVHMGCLLETADGALLVVHLDAGFAAITKVRASRIRVTAKGVGPG